ncbi:MAG: S4 domain-containing protein [Candidatus Contendobacter sp.]|nr:S4 domain-containing protein [Candidatus Contendobacter sp.]MDS4059175.1 S4 domain-containing protein [Candidatus Contendobacter sp.]
MNAVESDERLAVASGAVDRVRLDKWLWAARFFKTRALATAAVTGGKVHAGGQRCKPSHSVRLGESLQIQRGLDEYVITVRALNDQRGPASVAALLYEETSESRQRREALHERRRLERSPVPQPAGRPTKQDRRRIVRFTHGDD